MTTVQILAAVPLREPCGVICAGCADACVISRWLRPEMWDIDEPVHAKVRHIHIHLSTTVGRLASAIEPADHDAFHGKQSEEADAGAIGRIIADLIIHAG